VTITIPETAEGLEDLLTDRAKMSEIAKDGQLKDVITAYANIRMKNDPAILAQVNEQLQATMAQMLRDNGAGSTPIPKNLERMTALSDDQRRLAQRSKFYNRKAAGAQADDTFADAADYFQAVAANSGQNLRQRIGTERSGQLATALGDLSKIQNAFGSTVPADGGFLIPEVLRSDLLMWSLENSIIRPRATVIPMSSLRLPIPMVDSTSNQTSVFGGIQTFWSEEGAPLVDTSATFGQVTLEARKLTAYSTVPNELVADAPAFEGFFGQAFPAAISFQEDASFMLGSGVGEPAGALASATNPSVIAVAAQPGQPTASIVWENIVGMYARMLPSSLGSGVWIASIDTFPQLATVGAPMSILGRPVIFTEKCPSLTNQGDISFVDLSYYLIGDRQVMQSSSSEHFAFNQDKTAFRVIQRVDGRPWLSGAITPKNGGATLSPFVQLATR